MKRYRCAVAGTLVLILTCSEACRPTAENKPPPNDKAVADSKAHADEPAVFNMKEVSLYDQKERAEVSEFPIFGGQIASLRTQPANEVKAYPKLKSKQPLYGSIVFHGSPGKPGSARKFYFVLDESGTAENVNDKATKADADKSAVDNRPKSRYDLLYFDVDRDLDLTNDAVVSPMKSPPRALASLFDGPQATVIFNTVSMPLGEDPKAKGKAVSVLPVIILYGNIYDGNAGRMVFMAASARKGEVRLGKRAYSALLVPQSGMADRMNHANTPLILTSVDGAKPVASYPWMRMLGAIHEADGEFYRISATPAGDQLTVRPFGGERGVFELSVGNKDIRPLGIVAGLVFKESASKESMLLLGEMSYPIQAEPAKSIKYRMPVGDYWPSHLMVDCGDLRMSLRPDYTLNSGAASKPAAHPPPSWLNAGRIVPPIGRNCQMPEWFRRVSEPPSGRECSFSG